MVESAQANEENAVCELLKRFTPLIRNVSYRVFDAIGYIGLEVCDLLSVGEYGICIAIESYNANRGSFPAYAKLLVTRMVWNYVRENATPSKQLLNDAISLDAEQKGLDGLCFSDSLTGVDDDDLTFKTSAKEKIEYLQDFLGLNLDLLEQKVAQFRLIGLAPPEIMKRLAITKYRYYSLIDSIRLKFAAVIRQ